MTSGLASNWLGAERELTTEQETFLASTIAYYRELTAGNTEDPEDQLWVAQAEHRLVQLFSRLGQFDEALSSADRAMNLLQRMPLEWEPANVAMELADSLHDKDAILMQMGRIDEALTIAQQAAENTRELVSADPNNIRARKLLSEVTGNLGSRLQQLQRFDESLAAKTESVLIGEQLLLENPGDIGVKRSLGIKYMNLGILLTAMRNIADARERLKQFLEIRGERVELDRDSAVYQFDLAFVLHNLAGLEFRSNNLNEAESLAQRSPVIIRKLVQQNPLSEQYRRHLISSLGNQSAIFNVERKFEESKIALNDMITIAERSIRDFPNVPMYRILRANGSSSLAAALAEQGQYQEAIQYHDVAISQLREMIEHSIECCQSDADARNCIVCPRHSLGVRRSPRRRNRRLGRVDQCYSPGRS